MTAPDPSERERRAERIRRETWSGVDAGWTMAVELLTGTFLWGGAGWLLDRWLGTEPWLMSIGFFLGWGVATYIVYLRSEGRLMAPRRGRAPERGGEA
jgi:F0F1-type ATP synthase assembly protein I